MHLRTDFPHPPALFAHGSAQKRGGVHIFIWFESEIGGHLTLFFPLSWKNGTYLTSGSFNLSCLSLNLLNLDKMCPVSERSQLKLLCQLYFASLTTCGGAEVLQGVDNNTRERIFSSPYGPTSAVTSAALCEVCETQCSGCRCTVQAKVRVT